MRDPIRSVNDLPAPESLGSGFEATPSRFFKASEEGFVRTEGRQFCESRPSVCLHSKGWPVLLDKHGPKDHLTFKSFTLGSSLALR